MYILKLLLSIVTTGNKALVILGNKFCMLVSKKSAACETSHVMYGKTLKSLHRTIQNKRRGMLTSSIVLLHDNVHLHTAAHT
jgi:hypothetical protein